MEALSLLLSYNLYDLQVKAFATRLYTSPSSKFLAVGRGSDDGLAALGHLFGTGTPEVRCSALHLILLSS